MLPALPDNWKDGSVSGICARGGYEISMEWKENKLINMSIKSKKGGQTKILYKDLSKIVNLKEGETILVRW